MNFHPGVWDEEGCNLLKVQVFFSHRLVDQYNPNEEPRGK